MPLLPEGGVAPQRGERGAVQWPCGMAAHSLSPWLNPTPGEARGDQEAGRPPRSKVAAAARAAQSQRSSFPQ
eukprot:1924041-Alexandrium_andersonii.AAC.1